MYFSVSYFVPFLKVFYPVLHCDYYCVYLRKTMLIAIRNEAETSWEYSKLLTILGSEAITNLSSRTILLFDMYTSIALSLCDHT